MCISKCHRCPKRYTCREGAWDKRKDSGVMANPDKTKRGGDPGSLPVGNYVSKTRQDRPFQKSEQREPRMAPTHSMGPGV